MNWYDKTAKLVFEDHEFFYIAGPMSSRKSLNFPAFDRAALKLRQNGYFVSSPSEYEHEQARAKIMEAQGHEPHDDLGFRWTDCLARDVCVVSHPKCVGVVCLPGWTKSRGALLETFVADRLEKAIYEYEDEEPDSVRGPILILIDRDVALKASLRPEVQNRDLEDEAFQDLELRLATR